ncbi:MAG TPA: N-acetyl sugar amidotransferase [Candidatus Eisenbacteria bacterium]|nr:N-acetyl sugar amidotransferase [Candidatus Eisenbacteria bacterium]
MEVGQRRTCARCVYDEGVPGIEFGPDGVCNYCRLHDQMDRQYPTGEAGDRILSDLAATMRAAGRGHRYDCVVGVSGGCDSSYMLWKMVELGVRPLAVHFDNTWNSPIATQNIYNVLDHLGIELHTLVVNSKEYDDIYRSFMLAGVKDVEAPTDIGLITTLYRAAEEHGVKYIVEGHSFRTEGVAPLGWIYMDGRYIAGIQERFGSRPLKTFPNLWLKDFLRWSAIRNIRRVRPLYYMDYQKASARAFLERELGWVWYGGHHLENRFTAFWHTYFLPRRYGIDARQLGHAALVRSGQVDRAKALAELAQPVIADPEIVALVKKRLRFSDEEFDSIMEIPRRDYWDYPTYKETFERLRPLFWLLYRLDRVPKSFYLKFTRPDPARTASRIETPRPLARAAPSLPRPD